MMRSLLQLATVVILINGLAATPTPTEEEAAAKVQPRGPPITDPAELAAAIAGLEADAGDGPLFASIFADILTDIVPSPGPTAVKDVKASLSSIFAANPTDLFASSAELLLSGLAGGNLQQIEHLYSKQSQTKNNNPRKASPAIYPKGGPHDAPFSKSAKVLQEAIYIPPGFQYGKIQPLIFIPGAGSLGGQNFGPNFGKLFEKTKLVDPVYLNIPGDQWEDYQVGAEFVAYAVNYISSISGHRNVSTLSFSVGSLQAQWALKYWPSTRSKISDAIRISSAYHGTILADGADPHFPATPAAPGLTQVRYDSEFVATLLNNDGSSGYVPTTNVWSISDELVEPSAGKNASGQLGDARGVGVTNTELQHVCSLALPGGTFYNTHEGVLYNALAYALTVDALTHEGPGRVSRLDVKTLCNEDATKGLSVDDVLATEALVPLIFFRLETHKKKVTAEPKIRPYAKKDTPK